MKYLRIIEKETLLEATNKKSLFCHEEWLWKPKNGSVKRSNLGSIFTLF